MFSLRRAWQISEVRRSLLFVLGIFFLFRVFAHLPVPGIDPTALASFFEKNQLFGLLNLFSGGTLENMSVAALGVAPYITASIILQLLAMIIPSMEELQKEEQGRRRIQQWTRYLTVPLALLQGYGILSILRNQALGVVPDFTLFQWTVALFSLTAGSLFLLWLGELISEKHVGNGVSIMILASILASVPSLVRQAFSVYDSSQLILFLGVAVILIVTLVGTVIVTEAQRNIPIQHARMNHASRLSRGVGSHLPIRLNMAGVIPIIFAVSILLFPPFVAGFFTTATTPWIRDGAAAFARLFADPVFYGVAYFLLVLGFTFFYASVIFHPDRVAEQLQKQGAFIPGIRPGPSTSSYLTWVSRRLLLFGGIFLALIAVLPVMLQAGTGQANLAVGGSSFLIVVSVFIESMKQIESQVSMREYDV